MSTWGKVGLVTGCVVLLVTGCEIGRYYKSLNAPPKTNPAPRPPKTKAAEPRKVPVRPSPDKAHVPQCNPAPGSRCA